MSKSQYPRLEELVERTKEWAKDHPAQAGLAIVTLSCVALFALSKLAWKK